MNTNGLFCTTSVSDTNWSREWKNSSGTRIWLEQGGFVNKTNTGGYTLITFSKAFNSKPLRCVYNAAYPDGAYPNYYNLTFICDSISTTKMSIFTKNTSNVQQTQYGYWYACGK